MTPPTRPSGGAFDIRWHGRCYGACPRQARAGSESAKAGKAAEIMDVNTEEVARVLRAQQVCRLIHGHTHRPARHRHAVDGQDCERWVVPDWYARWGYVACDAAGCTLRVEDLT